MADQEQDKQLDTLLDSLLSQYSDVEPRPGLETRVLSNLQEAGTKSTSQWWRVRSIWVGAAAAAVLAFVISFLVFLNTHREHPAPIVKNNPPSPPLVAPSPRPVEPAQEDAEVTAPLGRHITHTPERAAAASVSEIRREVFPTPVPLSDQEKLALRYLARTPREELVAQSHPDPVPDEDLLQNPQGVFNPLTNNRTSGNSN